MIKQGVRNEKMLCREIFFCSSIVRTIEANMLSFSLLHCKDRNRSYDVRYDLLVTSPSR